MDAALDTIKTKLQKAAGDSYMKDSPIIIGLWEELQQSREQVNQIVSSLTTAAAAHDDQ